MELIWNEINALRLVRRDSEQTELEGTLPPPQGRQVAELLDYSAEASIGLCRVEAGRLELNGAITARLTALDEKGEVFAFASDSAFTHGVIDEAFETGMLAEAQPRISSLSVRQATDERLLLTAVIDLDYTVTSSAPLRVLSGVAGVADMELKTCSIENSRRVELGSAMLRLSEELSGEGAASVLSHSVQLSVRDTAFENGGVTVSGSANIGVLCRGADGELIQLVRTLPFRENVETNGTADEVFAVASLRSSGVRALGTEFSLLEATADVEVTVFALRRGSLSLPLDAFSPSINFSCIKQRTTFLSAYGGGSVQHSMRENVTVPEELADIFTTLGATARPIVTGVTIGGGELAAEGLLVTRLIYRSSGGRLYSFSEDVPFSIRIAAPTEADHARLRVGCSASVTGGSGRAAQIGYNIDAAAEFFGETEAELVVGLAEQNAEPDEAIPSGLIIHRANEAETVFDIAKRFRLPSVRVRELNPDLEDGFPSGTRVLLIV